MQIKANLKYDRWFDNAKKKQTTSVFIFVSSFSLFLAEMHTATVLDKNLIYCYILITLITHKIYKKNCKIQCSKIINQDK